MKTETMADFKARIAALMDGKPGGEAYQIRNKAHPCVVRKEKTYGYNAWEKPREVSRSEARRILQTITKGNK